MSKTTNYKKKIIFLKFLLVLGISNFKKEEFTPQSVSNCFSSKNIIFTTLHFIKTTTFKIGYFSLTNKQALLDCDRTRRAIQNTREMWTKFVKILDQA